MTTNTNGAEDKRANFWQLQRDRVQRYLALRKTHGHTCAVETLLEGYPERQRKRMGPLIEGVPLAEGIARALPGFTTIGIHEDVIDISTPDTDAALELLLTCMCHNVANKIGLSEAEPILCDLDFEASRRAFPEMSICPLRRQVDGDLICVFRYSRPASYARPNHISSCGGNDE
jgi:hypothetical protein